ncbi:unnamed protein product [Cylicocyclus nassatus]|uniref:Glutathione synthetase n=1 Tax=Cylicocyclus nassatus TaxID=53992 RepID=A0AA36GV64_CYLNA|nr:unnamed protein product [Cylicocyclus nassatus]
MALKSLSSLEDEDHEDDDILSVVLKTQRRKNAFKYFITSSSPASRVQNLIATLYHDSAHDFDFLIERHKDVITTDIFTKGLIDILKQALAQRKTLAIQRSDYMCHKDLFSCEYTLKQVSKLHRRAIFELGYDKETIEKAVPRNEPVKLISVAIYKAWKLYSCRDSLVLVVVEEENQNQIDQRHVEYGLENLGIPVDQIERKTLAECSYW